MLLHHGRRRLLLLLVMRMHHGGLGLLLHLHVLHVIHALLPCLNFLNRLPQEADKLFLSATRSLAFQEWFQLSLDLINVRVLLGPELLNQSINSHIVLIDIDRLRLITRIHRHLVIAHHFALDGRLVGRSMDQIDGGRRGRHIFHTADRWWLATLLLLESRVTNATRACKGSS